MGRTVRGRSDVKKNPNPLSEKHPSAIQIEDRTCLICQETVGTRNAEGIKEGFSMLPCGHRFGSHCIKRYLGLTADEQPLCPICRHAAYHDACGHPVLPFLLKPDGTHPDLITDKTGKVCPPKSGEDLMTAPCEYCRLPEEQREQPAGKQTGLRATVKKPFRWLRDLVQEHVHIPFSRRKSIQALHEQSMSEEVSGAGDRRLTRQELRNRRRAPVNNGVWEGPWVDVQTRDLDWERWWNAQAPRGV